MRTLLAACAAGLLAAACTTPATETAEAKPDPRQGKEVRQVCFNQQIRNWRENDRDDRSVIIEKGVRDEYKLELMGTCQPDDAFISIGLVSRAGAGTCLSKGDRLVTDSRLDGSCSIRRIYEWHKDATAVAENTN